MLGREGEAMYIVYVACPGLIFAVFEGFMDDTGCHSKVAAG